VSRHIDRKQLKNPDQFVSFWGRVANFVTGHRTAVIGGVAGVLVVLFGSWAISAFLDKRAADSSRAFDRINRIATAEPATGTPPKPLTDGLPHFKTEEERLGAALKEADGFLASHGGKLRDEALLLKARYLLALGKPGDALGIYQSLVASGGLDNRLKFLALEGLAYAQEGSGQTDAALAAFSKLADDAQGAGGFYRDHALFNKARLLEKKGSGKEAEKIYKEILDKTPTTSMREEINDRLAALEGK
jgi:tetratricopeptide (TPR) repeat protein